MRTAIISTSIAVVLIVGALWTGDNILSLKGEIRNMKYQAQQRETYIAYQESALDNLRAQNVQLESEAAFWQAEYEEKQAKYLDLWNNPVVKEVEVEKIVEVSVAPDLCPFQSEEELQEWLDIVEYDLVDFGGGTNFTTQNCQTYALSMMLAAWRNGYIMSDEIVDNEAHVIVKAPIFTGPGEGYWLFIEPQMKQITTYMNNSEWRWK